MLRSGVSRFRGVGGPLEQRLEEYDALRLRDRVRADIERCGGVRRSLSTVGFWAVLCYRTSHALFRAGVGAPALLIQAAAYLLFGSEISRKAIIGPSLVVTHPSGVFIGPYCRIGKGCTIGMHAFIGSNTNPYDAGDYPTLDDKISIGPGARIMGPAVIGAECRIGPNAVVLRSIPANHVVIPASPRIVSRLQLAPTAMNETSVHAGTAEEATQSACARGRSGGAR